MKDFDSLLDIWNEQKTSSDVDYKEVILRFKTSKNKFTTKIWIELAWMFIAMLTIAFIWYFMNFHSWTTHLSMVIFELCCLLYIFTQVKNLKTLANDSLLETPEIHIAYLEKFRHNRYIQNTRNYYFYTLSIGIALGLYFIEFFEHLSIFGIWIAIIYSIGWFAFCTFFIRKWYIKKEEKRLNEMISELQRLKKQFTEA